MQQPSQSTDIRSSGTERANHEPGFRLRRGRNWVCLGLLYACYYLCRYNLGTVTPELAQEFRLNNQQTGWMSTGRDTGYSIGTFINGLFADSLGGKQSMAIGAIGTIIMNLAFFGFSTTTWDVAFLVVGFVLIRTLDGYLQSFGSPGMVKINAAWFKRSERGTFAGIFGAMIQLGQGGVNQLSSLLLTGFAISAFGITFATVPKQNWRIMFVLPPLILAVVLVVMWLLVKNHPEEAGYKVDHDDDSKQTPHEKLPLIQVFTKIAGNPLIWVNGGAYFCTGFVRRAYDFWWVKYMHDQYGVTKASSEYAWLSWLLPMAAVLGSFGAGWISDRLFNSRRSPVASLLYGVESFVILGAIMILGGGKGTPMLASLFLILISITCNSSHSIIGTAAVMDIGGRRMAGFALGVVNSFQYLGTILAGFYLGSLIDKYHWDALFVAMLPFSILGSVLMGVVAYMTRGRDVRGA